MLGLTRAPEILRNGLTWFNVDSPLSLPFLRGRLVILDFWTFCCINCMHVLPVLHRLEQKYPDDVTVIGVHSPKFPAERNSENVAAAITRYGIRHPVVHDPDMLLWQEYCVRAWPTLILIAPDGYVIGAISGEPDGDRLIDGIGEMIRGYRTNGLMSPVNIPSNPVPEASGSLRFPGKIKPLDGPDGARLWAVADSGHHQIVVFDDDGNEKYRFGKDKPSFVDCGPDCSGFNNPQGLVCGNGRIYVADTGNHAIRSIDLESGEITTIAGTGRRGEPIGMGRLPANDIDLASVWDLELIGNHLYFANAGTHQLGVVDMEGGTVQCLAGTGDEGILDGPADTSILAQPSGMAVDTATETLYFVDAETSAIRLIDLATNEVRTLVGTGLFDFGDQDGAFELARFQHPLGIAKSGDRVVVADSYNGRLRALDLKHGTVESVGEANFLSEDGLCLPTGEPAGVAVDGPDRFLVSDTNNHRIVEVRPSQQTVRTWTD